MAVIPGGTQLTLSYGTLACHRGIPVENHWSYSFYFSFCNDTLRRRRKKIYYLSVNKIFAFLPSFRRREINIDLNWVFLITFWGFSHFWQMSSFLLHSIILSCFQRSTPIVRSSPFFFFGGLLIWRHNPICWRVMKDQWYQKRDDLPQKSI